MSQGTLSHADEQVLNQVFDPEGAPEAQSVKIDPSLPSDPYITDQTILKAIKAQELQAIRIVEGYSPTPNLTPGYKSSPVSITDHDCQDKEQVYQQALTTLSNLIAAHPDYASAYNNRAQLRRWRYGERLISEAGTDQMRSIIGSTITDLRTAIKLSSPPSLGFAISPQQAKLLVQSWTQLGAVFWSLARRGQVKDEHEQRSVSNSDHRSELESDWWTWDGMRLEEEGSRCFFMAGVYGSDVGRSLAVKTNPYARLCGGIVKEALKREGSL
jgi:hypothetical protein